MDEEIRRLTTKLRGSSTEADVDALLTKLAPSAAGTSRENQPATSLSAPTQAKLTGPPLELHGVSIAAQPRASAEQLDAPNEIKRLHTKFKNCLRQSDITVEDFHHICFPPGISGAYESTMPLAEFIDILNIDLMLSLTMREQQTLLSNYGILDQNGSRSNVLDIKAFLVDADAWPSGKVALNEQATTTIVTKDVDEFELESNTKANIEALRNIHDLVHSKVRKSDPTAAPRAQQLHVEEEANRNSLSRTKDLGLPSPHDSFALDRDMDGPEPLPPTYAMSSALLSGEDVYRELQELRAKYAALEAKQSPSKVSPETITEFGPVEHGGRGRTSANFVRESLRELDKGTFYSRPELRKPGFSQSIESQLTYKTWTHPSKGTRSTIPSLTSVINRSFVPNETADAYPPSLDKGDVSVSKLCEQNIISKLLQLPDSKHCLNLLTSRIFERARLSDDGGYISSPQLLREMKSIGLSLSEKEIEVFSAGTSLLCFYSD